jgi:hypothetical protein
MSGSGPRNKGVRTERGIVKVLQASGIAAARVPLSGAAGGRFAGDVLLPLLGRDLCVEVKARADGFRELYSWLTARDVLIVKADRQEPLVIVRLSLAAEIALANPAGCGRRSRSASSSPSHCLRRRSAVSRFAVLRLRRYLRP